MVSDEGAPTEDAAVDQQVENEQEESKIPLADILVPTYQIFEWKHTLNLAAITGKEPSEQEFHTAKTNLLAEIEKHAMTYTYKDCCKYAWIQEDSNLLKNYEERNAKKLEELNAAIVNAKEQYGDVELKDSKLAKAHYLCRIGNYPAAIESYEDLLNEKAMESTGKVKIYLALMRIGLLSGDSKLAGESLVKAEKEFAKGGDWETRNRMRVYKAIHLASTERKFEEAATLLLSSLATFTAFELISFNHFVLITVILSMCALPRPILEDKISRSPEVLQVFAEDDVLRSFFQSYLACDYRTFMKSFGSAVTKVEQDQFLFQHYRFFVRTMRLNAYRQYLEPYTSIKISAMANAFGVTEEFIEDEVVSFIPSGRLSCKIDRILRTLECNSSEEEDNKLYLNVVKAGDSLINRIQMLSRVIDM